MGSYIVRRMLLIIPTLLIVTMVVFFSVRLIPGDVIDLMVAEIASIGNANVEITAQSLRHDLGLDVPVYVQYGRWLGNAITGDLGKSLWTHKPVIEEISSGLPISLEIGIIALLTGTLFAIPIGVYSAVRQDTWGDYTMRTIAILAICLPTFWVGSIVIIYSSIWWHWSPSLEYIPLSKNVLGNLLQFIIPGVILGMYLSGTIMRMTRTMMLEVLRQDYIRTAWSKGLSEKAVIMRHAVKNAVIPIITTIGLLIPVLIGGTVILENIFSLPGIGRLLVESLNRRDYPIVFGLNLIVAVVVLLCNFLVDLTYGYFDPRIKYK